MRALTKLAITSTANALKSRASGKQLVVRCFGKDSMRSHDAMIREEEAKKGITDKKSRLAYYQKQVYTLPREERAAYRGWLQSGITLLSGFPPVEGKLFIDPAEEKAAKKG